MHQRAVVLKITLWMLLLDLRKAFDSVPHPLAVLAMLEKKFPSSSHRFLSAWLDGHLRRLLVGDTGDLDDRSLYHLVTKGTAQGSVTSPAVFNVSIDPLMMKLASSDPDANVVAHSPQPDTECKGEAAFADDVAVIREKIKELKQVKEICWNWANENGHEFVGKKCGVMALGLKPKKKELKSAKIPNGNDTIPLPDEYKHLGINYNRSSSLKVENAFLDYSFRLQKLKNSLNTYRRIWGSSSGTPTKVGAQMAWSITYQSLFYGAEVLPVKPKKMNQALGTVAKSVLGRYRSSSNSNAMEFLGWCNAEIYGAWCAVRFAISMLCHTLAQYRSSAGRLLMENERKQLPWAKYVWKSIKLLRLEEYFHKHLQNDGSNDMHTEEAQAELDLRKLDYKVATMRHPIVKHYAKAHHSFIFMDENSTFNPRFFKDPPKQCWVCKLPNTSDSPNHLVRECKRDVVKQILEATWIELGILRYASRNSLSHLLLSKSKPLYVNLTARQCNVLGRCHTRLYLLRKDCRDSTIALRRRL